MRFIDTEGTGFHGITVLLQGAKNDGNVELFCPWTETIQDSIDWVEDYMLDPEGVVGFNWSFDQFHIQKLFNILQLAKEELGPWEFMEDHINAIAELEPRARYGQCIRPHKVLDLMLHARKGRFQSLMNRKDIRIRAVPYMLAEKVVAELNDKIILPDIYFAKKKDPTQRWKIMDRLNSKGEVIPDLVDIVLKFAPSGSLKTLAIATGVRSGERAYFEDITVGDQFMSNEPGWAPYASAPIQLKNKQWKRPSPVDWYGRWPQWIHKHIQHWAFNVDARIYAAADVDDTRGLYRFFDKPELGDVDSELAAMVGSVRWRGFNIDRKQLQTLLDETNKALEGYKFSFNSSKVCKRLLSAKLTEAEQILLPDTSSETLSAMVEWKEETVCNDCFGSGCEKCNDKGTISGTERHPVATVAKQILAARKLDKKRQDLNKLLMTDMFHADFNVIGAKSNRMSGAGGLNAQGINADPRIRAAFTMANEGEVLDGGDFNSFEVTILDAEYNDEQLHADLLSGHKIHAVMAQGLYDMSYEDVLATAGTDDDKYFFGKRGIFALAYGGNESTLARKCHVSVEKALEGYHRFVSRYPGLGAGRQKVTSEHTCLVQPRTGGKIEWCPPAEYVESMLGFKRYFTLEYEICHALYSIGENPPDDWNINKSTAIIRREKTQSPLGATRTALFAAAFNITSSVVRAAMNHKIQSPGAQITKELQKRIWDLQPIGINDWKVRPMQVHDEILVVRSPELEQDIKNIVDQFLVEYRNIVPLLGIDWKTHMTSWANTH